MSLAQPPEVGSAAETAAAARAGHRSTLPLAAERDSFSAYTTLKSFQLTAKVRLVAEYEFDIWL